MHPVFNPVAPYRYLLPNLYLSCLRVVVGPGLVSTSSAFMRSIASHPSGPHGHLAQKTVIGPPLLGAGGVDIICIGFATACMLCRLEPSCLIDQLP